MDESGFGGGLTLIAAVREAGLHQGVMKSIAADLSKIGITLTMKTYSQAEYYGSLLSDPLKAQAGVWDIAEPGWTPDWFGNNGRAIVQPLFQTNHTAGTTNYGCYSNPAVDRLIDRALQAGDPAEAEQLWHEVDELVMRDLPIVPLLAFAAMSSRFHSPRVRNVAHVPQIEFFDITHLSLDPADTS
jgi:peptide/nickel transport system substrate-binding protein